MCYCLDDWFLYICIFTSGTDQANDDGCRRWRALDEDRH